jgi:hypothetical protein
MALTRITSDGITDATIATADLADQSVTLAKIADDAVNGNKIANGAVGGDAILDNAIGTVKIQDNAITLAKLPHGDGSSDGKFLRANNGADPTFESVVTDLVNDTSPQLGGDLDTNSFEINLDDNHSVNFGDSTDLNIKHTGVYGVLQNTTGNFFLQGENALTIKANNNVEILKATGDENMAKFIPDGAVELYHNNSKKLETGASGVAVTGYVNLLGDGTNSGGSLYIPDSNGNSSKIHVGTGSDLQIYHDGTNTYLDNNTGQFNIDAASGNGIRFLVDGVYQCQVYTSGIDLPDTKKLRLGDSEDLQIFHDGSLGGSNIAHVGSGNLHIRAKSGEESIVAVPDGQVEIYHDSSKKFETTSTGVTISGNAKFVNNDKAIFGTGNDAAIYHNDTDFHIDAQDSGATRNIYITCGTTSEGGFYVRSDAGDTMIKALTDSSCFLYYDNALMFRTMTDHCEIRGHLLPDTNNTDDIGSSSKRFRNIYTNDLNLSNEGSSNDVDGTWGSYTIQEGAEDLFLVNKRSGKKYKFNLTEVS